MTPGDETSKPPEPGGGRDDHVRCFGCGKRIPGAVSTCPKCAAVQNALCECGATNSAYSTECFACHAELTPRTYSQRLTTLRAAVIVAILIAIAYTAYRLFPRDPYKARHSAFTEAASDFEQGRYEFSRVKFARYLEEHNEYAPARYMLGLSLYRSGRQDEGVAQVRRALEVDPDLEQAVEFLAIAAYDAGRIDEALKVSKEALAAGRTPWVFHLIAGKSLSHPGHMDVTRAAWHLRQALRNGIEDPEALLLLAEHTLVIERVYPDELHRQDSVAHLESARDHVAELMRKEPERADLRFFAARCALALGDVSGAWSHLQVCLRLGEELPPHRLFRARVEWMRDNPAGAKRLLDELIAGDPSAGTFLSVAYLYLEEDSPELASATIARGRAKFPDDPGLLLADAETKPERAVELLRRAAELRPDSPRIVVDLADALSAGADGADEAEQVLRDHIQSKGASPLVDLRLAELLLAARGVDRADRKLKLAEAVRLVDRAEAAAHPGDPIGIYLLLIRAQVRIHQRRLDEAATLLADITSRRPGEPLAHILLADIHRARGENELAVLELTTVVRIAGESAPVLRARAEALLRMGPDSLATARKDAYRARELEPSSEEGLLLLARIEAAVGPSRAEEARGWLRQAAAKPGATARPWIELGRLEARRGNLDDAEESLIAARDRASSAVERLEVSAALAALESIRAGEFFPPGARRLFEQQIEGDPTDLGSRLRYAALLLDAGDPAGARKWAQGVIDEDPRDVSALAILFECAVADGEAGRPEADRYIHQLTLADPGGPVDAYARGRLSLVEEDFPTAVEFFERALDGAPGNVRTAFFLGVAHYRAGNLEAAQGALERAIALAPDLLSARRLLAEVAVGRGSALIEEGESERAIPLLQRGLAVAPDHLGLLTLLVEAQFAAAQSGDLGLLDMEEEDCLRLVNQLIAVEGEIDEESRLAALKWAYGRLETVYLAERDWVSLLATIESLLELEPGSPDAGLRKGLVLLLAGNPEKAAAVLERMVGRDGEVWMGRAMLAEAYLRTGRSDAAMRTVTAWLESWPDHAPARGFLGRIRVKSGDRELAVGDLTAALAMDPDLVDVAEALLDLQIERGRVGEAVASLRAILPTTKFRAEILFLLGRARLATDFRSSDGLGLLTEARKTGFQLDRMRVFSTLVELRVLLDRDRLEDAVAIGLEFSDWARDGVRRDPEPRLAALIAETWCLSGVAYRRMGVFDLAEHRYRKALEALPGFPMALNNLAEALTATAETRQAEDLAEAVTLAKRAVEAEPAEAEYLDTLALALLKSGRTEEAVEAYQGLAVLHTRALAAAEGASRELLAVKLARAEAGLAVALFAGGERDKAGDAFRRAISRYPGIASEPSYREIATELE